MSRGSRRERGRGKPSRSDEPAADPRELITTDEGLAELVEVVLREGLCAVDTEFHGERVYHPKLFLVQVAAGDRVCAIDPLAVENLEPLVDALADPRVETILHAGEIDLAILYQRYGKLPSRVFDTQVAAGLVGLPYPMGLSKMVEQLLGTRMAKGQTLSDWSQRPLRRNQLEYALEDVRYLRALRTHILARLDELGRRHWLDEEMRDRRMPQRFLMDPSDAYMRVSGWARLKGPARAVLQKLAAYREAEAAHLDRPVQQVLDDRLLTDLARQQPTSTDKLSQHRRMHPGLIRKHGQGIVKAVADGQTCDPADYPRSGKRPLTPVQAAVADLLSAVLKVICRSEGVAMELVGPRTYIPALVRSAPATVEEACAVLGGWRAELLGARLFGFMQGTHALALSPTDQRARFIEVDPEAD